MIELNRISDIVTIASFTENTRKLNVVIAGKVKEDLISLIENGCNNLIIDLSNIIFIDSSGFGALVTIFNHAKNRGSRVLLTNIADETMELVKVTKLDQVFDLYTSVDNAMKSII